LFLCFSISPRYSFIELIEDDDDITETGGSLDLIGVKPVVCYSRLSITQFVTLRHIKVKNGRQLYLQIKVPLKFYHGF
jgi:hypothetical protein